MDMFNFDFMTANEIDLQLAHRVRNIRRRRKITQSKISEMSGVSLGSVKRFEQTGEISLVSLTKITIALGIEEELKNIFSNIPYMTLEEIENEQNLKA